ncbi:MAG: (2Fe-2S)-binding protein [Salinivirgaceae bacterium]|nr:(2Fe-2S)-binding protein [Salinivirgaceae bacterium]MDD4748025.1 (2Fe-2S)-binding protein [Salinivirgaceae bacterium]
MSEIICNCMGITKQEIVDAIKNEGCKTFEDIQKVTEAGTVCGGCEDDINDIIKETL